MPPARRSFSDAVDSASAAPVSSDETPLLRNDAVKPKFQRVIVAISVILLISQVGNFIAMAPQTAILEGIICREHAPLSSESEDGLCKSEPVQTELALVLGWKDTFEMIPGLLLAVPYGSVADRIGRRNIIVLSLLGLCLGDAYVRVICWFSNTFNVRAIWLSGLWQLIGGGATTLNSILFVIVADICPPENRITAFAHIQSAMIVSEMVCVFLGARLMAGNPWVPFLLSCVINLLGIVLALVLLPETIHRKALTEATEGDPIVDEAVTTPKTDNSSSSIREIIAGVSDKFSGIRRNPGIILVLSSFFFVHMGTYGPSLILQYMAKKFGWTYENASYLISLRAALHLAVLNLLIPLASRIGKRGLRLNDAHLDRILTQLSGIFLISGAALAFISPTPTLMVLSQVIATLGITFGVTARSVVTNLARQEDLGVVYTSISVAAYGGALVGGPFLAFLFGWGLRLGHMWTGMPFLGSVVLTSIALVAVSLKG